MKFEFNYRMVMIFFFVLLTGACTVTQEKYRYQHRFDDFYSILNKQERKFFQRNELENFGKLIDERQKKDSAFAASLKDVKDYEAISTFDGEQTGSFFRNTILRELNREHFYRLMNMLSNEGQIRFVRSDDFVDLMKNKIKSDKKFKKWVDRAKGEYRLEDFTLEELFAFYRNVSFNELARRHFYLLLKVLKEARALDYFLTGNVDKAADILDGEIKSSVSVKHKFSEFKKLSSLTHVSVNNILKLYFDIVMPEMDQEVVKRTVGKFY